MENQEIIEKIDKFLKEEGVVIPKGPIKEFYSQLLKLSGIGLGGLLNLSGKKAGQIAGHYIRDLIDNQNIPDKEEILNYIRIFLTDAGICQVVAGKVEGKKIILTVKNSLFAEGMENRKPVCMPLAGALSGAFEELTNKKWDCKEIECQAQGKDYCIFELIEK